MLTLEDLAIEVSGISGKRVDVITNHEGQYSIGPHPEIKGHLRLNVPDSIVYITNDVRASVYHEAMHGLYSGKTWPNKCQIDDLAKSFGLGSSDFLDVFHKMLNAFEDVRIEALGAREFEGAGPCFLAHNKGMQKKVFPMIVGKIVDSRSEWEAVTLAERAKFDMSLYLSMAFLDRSQAYPTLVDKTHKEEVRRAVYYLTNTVFKNWWEINLPQKVKEKYKLTTIPSIEVTHATLLDELMGVVDLNGLISFVTEYYYPLINDSLPSDLKEKQKDIAQFMEALKKLAEMLGLKGQRQPEDLGDKQDVSETMEIEAGKETEEEGESVMAKAIDEKGKVFSKDSKQRLPVVEEISKNIYRKLLPIIQEIKKFEECHGEASFQRRGKLDNNLIYRVPFNDKYVFKREVLPGFNDDIAACCLVDTSGSMGEDCCGRSGKEEPASIAFGASLGILRALKELNKSASLVTFDSSPEVHFTAKDEIVPSKVMELISNVAGDNHIHTGCPVAIKELAQAEEKLKLLFIITDGGFNPIHIDYMKNLRKECEPHGIRPYTFFVGETREAKEIMNILKSQKLDGYVIPSEKVEELVTHMGKIVYSLMREPV